MEEKVYARPDQIPCTTSYSSSASPPTSGSGERPPSPAREG